MVNYAIFRKTRSLRAAIFGQIALPSVLLYRDLFKRYKTSWGENRESLSRFEDGTLGKELSLFLNAHELELQAKMENHDVFHVILSYDNSLPEEAALHFFLLGNGKKSHYALIAATIGFMIFPEYWELYRSAYGRGKQTIPFGHWQFKEMLSANLEDVRRDIRLPPR